MTQQTPQVPSTEPQLTGVRNFRDLGGLPTADGRYTRRGVLFRSGHLAHATEQDAVFLSSLGLHTVFDFRNSSDIRADGPDVELPGVRHVNLPLSDPIGGRQFWKTVRGGDLATLHRMLGDGRAEARMIETYREIVTTRTAEHRQVLDALADGSVPVLLHCTAGKDRAGLTVAVALLAVGVDRAVVEADYLKSAAAQSRYQLRRGGASRLSPEVLALVEPLFDARAEYLAAAFDTIDERWGGVERYLAEGLGVGPDLRDRLRARLLAD